MKLSRPFVVHALLMAVCVSIVAYASYVRAQAPASQTPPATVDESKFDAVSIKVNNSGSGRNSLSPNMAGGRLRAVNVSLAGFLTFAYDLPANRIFGAPDWFDTEHFDVDATASSEGNSDDNRARIKSFLADRFKVAVHHETRQLPVYALVLDKPGKLGPQLQMSDGDCSTWHVTNLSQPNAASSPSSTPDSINCGDTSGSTGRLVARFLGHGVTMEQLVQVLSGTPSRPYVERPIVDRTGLTGLIDFVLEFAPPQFAPSNDQASADPSAPPSFTTALHDELGLKLESATGPVDVLVIDHVEEPSPN
jgi:uncharacterized protein (TIGR03435 family)